MVKHMIVWKFKDELENKAAVRSLIYLGNGCGERVGAYVHFFEASAVGHNNEQILVCRGALIFSDYGRGNVVCNRKRKRHCRADANENENTFY